MKQLGPTYARLVKRSKKTRKAEFLEQMERVASAGAGRAPLPQDEAWARAAPDPIGVNTEPPRVYRSLYFLRG